MRRVFIFRGSGALNIQGSLQALDRVMAARAEIVGLGWQAGKPNGYQETDSWEFKFEFKFESRVVIWLGHQE